MSFQTHQDRVCRDLIGLDAQAAAGEGDSAANTSHLVQGLIQGVMQGIGFLGAGAIKRSQMSVKGLTTAVPRSGPQLISDQPGVDGAELLVR